MIGTNLDKVREGYKALITALVKAQDNGERNIKLSFSDAKAIHTFLHGLFITLDKFEDANIKAVKLNHDEKAILDAKPEVYMSKKKIKYENAKKRR